MCKVSWVTDWLFDVSSFVVFDNYMHFRHQLKAHCLTEAVVCNTFMPLLVITRWRHSVFELSMCQSVSSWSYNKCLSYKPLVWISQNLQLRYSCGQRWTDHILRPKGQEVRVIIMPSIDKNYLFKYALFRQRHAKRSRGQGHNDAKYRRLKSI